MDKIIVLDFGSQYTHLIARRIRQLRVYSEIRPPSEVLKDLKNVKGVILSGGPSSVYEKNAQKVDKKILNLDIPVLGICYGHQLISHLLGGRVEGGKLREYGFSKLTLGYSPLFKGLGREEVVWMSHGDHVRVLPEGFKSIARTESCDNAAISDEKKRLYGLQFHPEVTHTRSGLKILDNFLRICRVKRGWDVEKYLGQVKREIKEKVGNKKVFLLVSGGVDSTVSFVLLKKVLGRDKVLGLHVDNGFMRLNESYNVVKELKSLGLNVKLVDASKEFLKHLKKVVDPEKKRERIGKDFIQVTNKALKKLGLDKDEWLLAQGTIYPDTIESGDTKNSAKIKTHHNRVSIVRKLIVKGKMVEPLKELYKDEVRMLGKKLDIPYSLLSRHPFPGPGLAIRCLCQEKSQKIPSGVVKKVEKLVRKHSLKAKVLPVKSVGVQGDSRTYKNPVMLLGFAGWGTLERVAVEICNSVKEVNRVVLHVAGEKKLAPRRAYLTRERLDVLRRIDFLVRSFVKEKGYDNRTWQMPVILLPLGSKKGSIVLRPVCSTEVMTASFTRMNMEDVKVLASKILGTGLVSSVLYDITNKPPGTVEWE